MSQDKLRYLRYGRVSKKSHNVSLLLYHLECPAKYQKKIITDEVTKSLLLICFEITEKLVIEFIEIGKDWNHALYRRYLMHITAMWTHRSCDGDPPAE